VARRFRASFFVKSTSGMLARGTGRAAERGMRWADARTCKNRSVKVFTALQGRYLSFIYVYTKIHGRPPTESDLQRFFRVTSPTVHQMVVTLDRRGLISRRPGVPRSIGMLVPPQDLPLLEFLLPPSGVES
jgi:hypothetical protein